MHINIVGECQLSTLRGRRQKFLNYHVFLSLKVVLILANSEDPDEMQHYAAFHLGLHCWPKYLFRVSSIKKGFVNSVNFLAVYTL